MRAEKFTETTAQEQITTKKHKITSIVSLLEMHISRGHYNELDASAKNIKIQGRAYFTQRIHELEENSVCVKFNADELKEIEAIALRALTRTNKQLLTQTK